MSRCFNNYLYLDCKIGKHQSSFRKIYIEVRTILPMMFDTTKISSKGQVVIPLEMRKDLKEGDKLIVIRNNDQIILKKANKMDKALKEDLDFAKRTEKAWKNIDKGKYNEYSAEEFLKEIRNGDHSKRN